VNIENGTIGLWTLALLLLFFGAGWLLVELLRILGFVVDVFQRWRCGDDDPADTER